VLTDHAAAHCLRRYAARVQCHVQPRYRCQFFSNLKISICS
jgi:hypothetical protein